MRTRQLPFWSIVVVCLLSFGLPFVVAYLDGSLRQVVQNGTWRQLLHEPAIVLYSIIVAAWILPAIDQVLNGLRPVSKLDDEEYDRLVVRAAKVSPRAEMFAVAAGATFGLVLVISGQDGTQSSVLELYTVAANMAMFAVVSWGLYVLLVESQRLAAFHRHPLDVNVFDIEPFEPIGRLSLQISLAYVGGIIIGLVLGSSWTEFFIWQNVLIYGILVAVTFFLFFAIMGRTHRVLSQTQQEALATARRHIDAAYLTLERLSGRREDTQAVAAEITAWTIMEDRLKLTRTWPYNTEMLSTLFLSAVVPVLIAVIRPLITLGN